MNLKRGVLLFAVSLCSVSAYCQKPFAIVELFTSEGCSSCPAAENALRAIKDEAAGTKKNVLCLQYHVDYWNRLGWKDPYSSFQYTLRQKNYASVLHEESVYTPMMIVNGTTAFTGSDLHKAKSLIRAALTDTNAISLRLQLDSVSADTAYVSFTAGKSDKNFFLRVAITESNLVAKIGKGENAGKTLTHDAVVRVYASSDLNASSGQMKVPLKKFQLNPNCELIGFIQHKQSMKILAAASAQK